MILVVGLGNPGKKYEKTRHNLGYEVIAKLSKLNFDNIILAKPDTFMNESGKFVKNLIKKHELPITHLWVIHDEMDLKLGDLKIVQNRGAAGHKGVSSIIKELGAKNFTRFRMGINPDLTKRVYKDLDEFVVEKFSPDEEKIIKELIEKTKRAVLSALEDGVNKAMSVYN